MEHSLDLWIGQAQVWERTYTAESTGSNPGYFVGVLVDEQVPGSQTLLSSPA
jgi:hypothetical protein